MNKVFNSLGAILLGVLVASCLAYLAFKGTDWTDVLYILDTQTNLLLLMVAACFYLLFFLVKAMRWMTLLGGPANVSFYQLLSYVLVGYAGSVLVPMQMGELYRSVAMKRYHQLSATMTLTGIGLEKIIDLVVIVLMCVFALLASNTKVAGITDYLVLTVLFVGCASGIFWGLSFVARRISNGSLPRHKQSAIKQRALLAIHAMGQAMSLLRQYSVKVFIQTLLLWLCMAVSMYLVVAATAIELSWWMVFVLLFYSVIGLILPTAPGFVGTIQAVFVIALVPLGFEQARVLAAAILYNGLITLLPLILALIAGAFIALNNVKDSSQ